MQTSVSCALVLLILSHFCTLYGQVVGGGGKTARRGPKSREKYRPSSAEQSTFILDIGGFEIEKKRFLDIDIPKMATFDVRHGI